MNRCGRNCDSSNGVKSKGDCCCCGWATAEKVLGKVVQGFLEGKDRHRADNLEEGEERGRAKAFILPERLENVGEKRDMRALQWKMWKQKKDRKATSIFFSHS